MDAFLTMIATHLAAAGFGGGVLIVALISCLPTNRPKTKDEWYAYFRNSLQTAIPASRHPDPTQPASSQEKAPPPEIQPKQ